MSFISFTMVTVDDVISRLDSRGNNHGLEVEDLLQKIPTNVVDCYKEVNEWLDIKDISHIQPSSTHPHLQSDPGNWVWEDSGVNRARGGVPMTEAEVLTAQIDNQLDAQIIDGPSADIPDSEWAEVLSEADVFVDFETPDLSIAFI